MRIMILTNTTLPIASEYFGEPVRPYGGWIDSTVNLLPGISEIEIHVVFPRHNISDVICFSGSSVIYHAVPPADIKKSDQENEKHFQKVIDEVKPDIVHIFGTEFYQTLVMAQICKRRNIRFVISIQGMTSYISKHYTAFLPYRVQRRFTIRDFIKQDNILQQKKKYEAKGLYEAEAIKNSYHIIGRTTWDRACVSQINKHAQYHYCNEILRDEFYNNQWNPDRCEKYTIFVSQGYYPLKGLHIVLEAMPLILSEYPDAKLYVGGINLLKFSNIIRISSYTKYIIELIRKYDLSDKVIFTDVLDEKQICDRLLKSNVFVSPSSIENSSNSLGEAMLLGVPCIASYVGGNPDMLIHNEEGYFYQADAPYMLASFVCNIFGDEELANRFSQNARAHAGKTHNKIENIQTLLRIYKEIIEK